MPREIKAWACAFGCGRKVSTKRATVEKHERTCFCNPARRACKTCGNDHKRDDPEDCFCELDFGKPEGETMRPYDGGRLTCRANCPKWRPK